MRLIRNHGTVSGGIRVLVCSAVIAAAMLSAACSGPSRITVTGMNSAAPEVLPGTDQTADVFDPGADGAEGKEPDESVLADSGYPAAAAAKSQDAGSDSLPQIAVYVCGAVVSPGVYYLPDGARICDALDAAGGFSGSADKEWLNQAKALTDGEMLVAYTTDETAQMRAAGLGQGSVSGSEPAQAGTGKTGDGTGGESLVNLNTASKEQLMTLPGIGEAKADAIIRYRTETGFFASTEDVMNISGIKNSIYDRIRDRITV